MITRRCDPYVMSGNHGFLRATSSGRSRLEGAAGSSSAWSPWRSTVPTMCPVPSCWQGTDRLRLVPTAIASPIAAVLTLTAFEEGTAGS